jgi:hypothetical protein
MFEYAGTRDVTIRPFKRQLIPQLSHRLLYGSYSRVVPKTVACQVR